MKLEFRLLVIDDNPDQISQAIEGLSDHLKSKGFRLKKLAPPGFSEQQLRDLAKTEKKQFDLVMVDYNLGGGPADGAGVTKYLRNLLQYTDMVFYSSDPSAMLLKKLADEQIAGVFVSSRQDLAQALIGLAKTVIGKAVDLNHMRGIAMAEVADMDVLMEETLEIVFKSDAPCFDGKAQETLSGLVASADRNAAKVREVADKGFILEAVGDSRLMSSFHRYNSLREAAKSLPVKPAQALIDIKNYQNDILGNRNTLAHAKEETNGDGSLSLRSAVRGQPSILIDEPWLADFREKLHANREALHMICKAIREHVEAHSSAQNAQQSQA